MEAKKIGGGQKEKNQVLDGEGHKVNTACHHSEGYDEWGARSHKTGSRTQEPVKMSKDTVTIEEPEPKTR